MPHTPRDKQKGRGPKSTLARGLRSEGSFEARIVAAQCARISAASHFKKTWNIRIAGRKLEEAHPVASTGTAPPKLRGPTQ